MTPPVGGSPPTGLPAAPPGFIVKVLACFAGCFLGAYAEKVLVFPGAGSALLFAPYAVLTTALLGTPPRRWWILLLAASAGNYLPHRHGGASTSFVLMTEGANHLRAIIAALGLRRGASAAGRGETMSDMVAFLLFAVVVGPAVGAFAGTMIVAWHRPGTDWALIWGQWWLSNAITALTLLPLLMVTVDRLARGTLRALRPSVDVTLEALLLSLGLLAAGAGVFLGPFDGFRVHPARLFWPLPFLLWAAVRFGPTGISAALSGVTALSIWGALEQRGPFVAQSSGGNLLEIQAFLLCISVPLLLLAAIFRQQQRTAAALAESRLLYQATEEERRRFEIRRALDEVHREANRRKDEFLAMLGHELRNPLAPIAIALETIRASPSGGAPAQWAIDSIRRQLKHMTRLLDDLLDISRITLGRIRVERETLDLGVAVANAVETTRPFIDALDVELVVDVPAAPVRVRGDLVRLTQIAGNLLNNAAKYSERGGRVEIHVAAEGELATLVVRDYGIGIPSDSLERIFELFTQVSPAREPAAGGLGIGLALVKQLVELHGGTVEARSPARGTEMIVRLPRVEGGAPAPTRPRAVPDGAGAPRRIVVVDDNPDIAEGLGQILKIWGHAVQTAGDGSAALDAVAAFNPDVVLVDLGLPQIDGLEVGRRLTLRDPSRSQLLISMSGFGQEQARRESQRAGFHHHLVKPLDMEALRDLVAEGQPPASVSTPVGTRT